MQQNATFSFSQYLRRGGQRTDAGTERNAGEGKAQPRHIYNKVCRCTRRGVSDGASLPFPAPGVPRSSQSCDGKVKITKKSSSLSGSCPLCRFSCSQPSKYLCALPKEMFFTISPRASSSYGTSPFSTQLPMMLQSILLKYSCLE